MVRLHRRLLSIAIAAALALALPLAGAASAQAGGYKRHHYGSYGHYSYKHYGYRHHGRHHYGYRYGHHDDYAAFAVAGAIFGGLVLAHLLTRPSYPPRPSATRVAAPVPAGLGNCKPTTGERVINGRLALMSGTWCSDRYGRGYILNDSVRFVRYLN